MASWPGNSQLTISCEEGRQVCGVLVRDRRRRVANVRFALWLGGNGIFTSFPGGGERFIGVRALPNIRQLGEADVRIEAQT